MKEEFKERSCSYRHFNTSEPDEYKAYLKAVAERVPEKLQKKDVARLLKTLRSMIKIAKARYGVTLPMLRKRAKCNVDDKVVRKALLKKKIKFRRLRSKPLLTEEDRKERFAFARKKTKVRLVRGG